MHDYDKSSKWLIEHHGDSILRLAGMSNIRSWKPLQAELVQPRQLPDGLLEVQFADQSEQDLFLIEIATYFEERLIEQMTRDVMLVYLDRRNCPKPSCSFSIRVGVRLPGMPFTHKAVWER